MTISIGKKLIVALLLFLPSAHATWAVIGTPPAITGNTGSSITSPSYNTTGASHVFLHATCYGVLAVAANITDNKSNGNPTAVGTGQNTSGESNSRLFYYANPTVGSGHTFTLSCTAPALAVIALSGGASSSVLDQNTGATGNSVFSLASGSITPGSNNELIICGGNGADSNSGTITVDSGMTAVATPLGYVGGSHVSNWMYYKIQTTAAAINVTVSDTVSEPGRSATIGSFKAGAAATSFMMPFVASVNDSGLHQLHVPQIVDVNILQGAHAGH